MVLVLALQAQGVGGRPVKYSGMLDVFAKTYQKEGLVGFYKVGRVQSLSNAKCLGLGGLSFAIEASVCCSQGVQAGRVFLLP